MAFSPGLIAEIKRRYPYASDEQIAELEKRYGSQPNIDWSKVARETAYKQAAASQASNAAGIMGYDNLGKWIGPAMAAYNIYDISKNDKMDKKQQATNVGKTAGMAVADYFAFGIPSIARALALRTGFGRKAERFVDNKLIRNDPINKAVAYSGLLGGLSTKAKQQQRAAELIDKGVTGFPEFYGLLKLGRDLYDKTYEDKLKGNRGIRTDLDAAFVGIDPESKQWVNNAFATSGKVEDLRPEDVWGGQGVFSTFGNDWLGKYNEEQRRKISQGLLDAALFKLDHGDVIISDRDKALAVRNEILGGDQGAPTFGPSEEEKEKEENAN